MYIKKLQLQNFQVIKDFSAEFDGNVYLITGDNELGKSTLLKAIGALLTGERDEVLRMGETKGFAKTIVGDDNEEYEVTLSFTENNPRGALSIKQKTTGMQSSNVSMLQKIFGYQDFDAVEFSRWSETAEGRRKQIEVVKALLPAEIKERIAEIDSRATELKSERTGVNRDIKTLSALTESAKKGIEVGDVEKYAEPVDIADLMNKQAQLVQLDEKANTVRSTLAIRKQQLEAIPARKAEFDRICTENKKAIEQEVEQARIAYEELKAKAKNRLESEEVKHNEAIKALDAERADYEARRANAEAWLDKYEKGRENYGKIDEQIKDAQAHNIKYNLVANYLKEAERLEDAKNKANELEGELEVIMGERAALVSKSKLPIKGLSFSDEGLTLNGVPFVPGKVSDSQIMEIATKLVIASNPTVKVFRIARGESLGEKRLKNIIEIATRYGYQGFIEEVQRGQTELVVEEYTEKE